MYYSILALAVFGVGCWVAHYNYCNIILSRIAPNIAPAAWRGRAAPLALMAASSLVLAAAAVILGVKAYAMHWALIVLGAVVVAYLGNFLAIRSSWHTVARKYPAELSAYQTAQTAQTAQTRDEAADS